MVGVLSDLKEQEVLRIVQERLAAEMTCSAFWKGHPAMEIVGKRFADQEYFLPDRYMRVNFAAGRNITLCLMCLREKII